MSSMSNGILALLKKDADIIETVINELNTTNEINNENKNSNDEEINEKVIEPSRNEEDIRVKINDIMQSTLFTSQSEVQLKQIQSLKYLNAPSALGYQSEKVNKMDVHKFINDFYTKNLGKIVGKGEKMTALMSQTM